MKGFQQFIVDSVEGILLLVRISLHTPGSNQSTSTTLFGLVCLPLFTVQRIPPNDQTDSSQVQTMKRKVSFCASVDLLLNIAMYRF